MKKAVLYFAFALFPATVISSTTCLAQKMSDAEILSIIKEHPYKSADCHSPYYFEEASYTAAPEGYKPFYISHLGRHGSRYQTDGKKIYDGIVSLLDSLHYAKSLTSQGDSLRMELIHLQQAHKGMDGMLTMRGSREHSDIATRLVKRSPSVFLQEDRKIVGCTATTRQRTIQSMAGFISGLGTAGPGLDYRIGCGFDMVDFKRPEDKPMERNTLESIIGAEEKSMAPDINELDALQARLFIGYKASEDKLFSLFLASVPAGCLDIDVNPLRFFTPEELFAFYKKRNVTFSAKYGTFAPVRAEVAKNAKPWLRMIVNDADKALDGNGHCADFRFAHDSNVGPLMNLLGLGGYGISAIEDAPYRYWQGFKQICMASNIQFEFYRNDKADVLVKALFNEKEINFPGLQAVNEVYYRWNDVRRYMIGKCNDVLELPDYYTSHIKAKAEEIRLLQKNEKEGFFFITDMHFPTNFGNSAALIESLEKMTENRLIVYGGDALTYLDDIDEAMAMQISALEQMRGVSPVLWARGNHDFVNYTGKKEWITKERKALPAWESEKLLGMFRPVGAISNENDPHTAYFYYDNPGKKVRYVIFDSSDTVQDDQRQRGLSETQLRWIIEKAVLDAPKGFGLVFISHRPFLGEEKRIPAADALAAFSTHSAFKLGNRSYDFALRPDLNMICLVCGHKHLDYSVKFPGGQPQINVVADCNYDYLNKPKGTAKEQSFDYISISSDGSIHTVRIGMGENRLF